jgi:hypothetical protein
MTAVPKKPDPPTGTRVQIVDLDFPGRKEHDDVVDFIEHYRGQGEADEQIRGRILKMADAAPEVDLDALRQPDEEQGGEGQEADKRPRIQVTTKEHLVNDQAVAALARDQTIFQRGNLLVRVASDTSPVSEGIRRPNAAYIEPLPKPILQERLAANARFFEITKQGYTDLHPPSWCVAAVHARGRWAGLRCLEAVVDYPVLRPDGTLLLTPGYDPATGLLLEPRGELPTVPEHPTRKDAERARDTLLRVVCDFPFEREEHKAAWLAALLTPLARFAFEGPAPLFLADANVRGSGKGKLLDCIAWIVSGERFSVATYPKEKEELRKRITSLALEGDRLALFDNVRGKFGNDVLEAVLTATVWKDRILGISRTARVPLLVVWYATGNNVVVSGDTTRRLCHIRLESNRERPEERPSSEFRHPDLLAWVKKKRTKLLGAALTILRGYCDAGRPDMELPAWGSYEGWSALVRNAVVWVGLSDPGKTRQLLQDRSDVEAEALASLLDGWDQMDAQGQGLTTDVVIKKLYPKDKDAAQEPYYAEFREAIETLGGRHDVTSLGYVLRSHKRRIVDGRYLDKASANRRCNRWVVRRAAEFHTPVSEQEDIVHAVHTVHESASSKGASRSSDAKKARQHRPR